MTFAQDKDKFEISTPLVEGAIATHPYSFNLAASAAGPGVAWSIASGHLPPGLNLASEGKLQGTPTTPGDYRFTVRVSDSADRKAQRQFRLIVSEAEPQYGNVGDPYATDGGGPKGHALDKCKPLGGGRYHLTADVAAVNPGEICFTLQDSGTRLDLGGHTVTGRIFSRANPSGSSIFNGKVTCNWDGRGGLTGCVNVLAEGRISDSFRLHHLTLSNLSKEDTRAMYVEWQSNEPYVNGSSIVLTHISSSVEDAPETARSYNLGAIGKNQSVEASYNDVHCSPTAAACQGIVCYGITQCLFYGNRVVLDHNTTEENGRALLFDGKTLQGDAWNNLLIVNNSRGVRVRDSNNVFIHDNRFKDVAGSAIHLGDPDRGTNKVSILVEHNVFEMAGGTVFFVRNVVGPIARENRIMISKPCPECAGQLGHVRSPLKKADQTEITILDTQGVESLASPQVSVEAGAAVFLCASGNGGGAGNVFAPEGCPIDKRSKVLSKPAPMPTASAPARSE